jgi:cell division protein FtsB
MPTATKTKPGDVRVVEDDTGQPLGATSDEPLAAEAVENDELSQLSRELRTKILAAAARVAGGESLPTKEITDVCLLCGIGLDRFRQLAATIAQRQAAASAIEAANREYSEVKRLAAEQMECRKQIDALREKYLAELGDLQRKMNDCDANRGGLATTLNQRRRTAKDLLESTADPAIQKSIEATQREIGNVQTTLGRVRSNLERAEADEARATAWSDALTKFRKGDRAASASDALRSLFHAAGLRFAPRDLLPDDALDRLVAAVATMMARGKAVATHRDEIDRLAKREAELSQRIEHLMREKLIPTSVSF